MLPASFRALVPAVPSGCWQCLEGKAFVGVSVWFTCSLTVTPTHTYDTASVSLFQNRLSCYLLEMPPTFMPPLNDNKDKLAPGALLLQLLTLSPAIPTTSSALTSCPLPLPPVASTVHCLTSVSTYSGLQAHPHGSQWPAEAQSFISLTVTKKGWELTDTTPVPPCICVPGLQTHWFHHMLTICQLHGRLRKGEWKGKEGRERNRGWEEKREVGEGEQGSKELACVVVGLASWGLEVRLKTQERADASALVEF